MRSPIRPQPFRWVGPWMTLAVLVSACGESPSDRELLAVNDWLTCIECTDGERAFVADSASDLINPILRDALLELPDDFRESMEHSVGADWAAVSGRGVDSLPYVNYFMENYEALVQRRAALALEDRLQVATLREALRRQGLLGYRPEVIDEIERALARASGGLGVAAPSTGPPASVEIQPPVVGGLRVGSTARLIAYVRDASGVRLRDDVSWRSTNTTFGAVQREALQRSIVTGLAGGTTQIWAETGNGVSAQMSVTVVDPPTLRLIKVGGDAQNARVRTQFSQPLVVEVRRGRAPVAGVTVRWTVVSGDAGFAAGGRTTTAVTVVSLGATGTVDVQVVAGSTPGPVQISADVDPGDPVFFNLNVIS
jgi:hypothetical protein